jgi:DNA polymerase V
MIWLMAENKKYSPIKVTPDNDFIIWGIVTTVIKSV